MKLMTSLGEARFLEDRGSETLLSHTHSLFFLLRQPQYTVGAGGEERGRASTGGVASLAGACAGAVFVL